METAYRDQETVDFESEPGEPVTPESLAGEPLGEQEKERLKSLLEGRARPLRVLCATDGSKASEAATHLLKRLPLPAGSAVKVLTVLDAPTWQVPESLRGAELVWARQVTEGAGAELIRNDIQVEPLIERGEPAFEILEAAKAFDADLIVVGSHGRTGIERFLLGSVAENVAKHAARPVLVVRGPQAVLRRIVLAVDGSEPADRAAELVARFPVPTGTEVTVCHIVRPFSPVIGPEYALNLDQMIIEVTEQRRADGEALVAQMAGELREAGLAVTTAVREGDPAGEIVALAKAHEADLVVAGARGLSDIRALIVGSVTGRLLKEAPCSVLIVH